MSLEARIRYQLQVPAQRPYPELFRHLLAFWPHLSLHRRPSDRTNIPIISIFGPSCPFPVWHREEWLEHAEPPASEYREEVPFFENLWQCFRHSPIPHNLGLANSNSDFADDCWHSRDCYLCHKALELERCYYCYRMVSCRDCQYCVFCAFCELSRDLVNCQRCYESLSLISCRGCRESAFCFDCRDCSHCLFCWNLRNKRYCIENVQYSKDEYLQRRASYDFASRRVYETARARFATAIETSAFWRASEQQQCEDCTGSYLNEMKNAEECFFSDKGEDLVRCFRTFETKTVLESVDVFKSELVYRSATASGFSYDIRNCVHTMNCRSLQYCMFCHNCEHCFGCCGLVGKRYHILNREYHPEEYRRRVSELQQTVERESGYGALFPPYFAANPYSESLAASYFPLSTEEQTYLGFRTSAPVETAASNAPSVAEIPDTPADASAEICHMVYRDERTGRPVRIYDFDIEFAQKVGTPLPAEFYTSRLHDNFAWLSFCGGLRDASCAETGTTVQTSLPERLDGRILCDSAYFALVR